MPGARLFRATDTLTFPGVVPVVGDTASQFPPEVVDAAAVNENAALLLALMARLCAAGNVPLLVKLKVSVAGRTVRVGSAATTKVTGISTGVLEAPVEASVTVPL